jgi:hypothetical protein
MALHLAVVLALAGCSTTRPATVPLWTGEDSPLALIRGRLEVLGPCVVVSDDQGSHTVIWHSPNTRWDPALGTITVEGTTAPLGSIVTLGGGEARLDGTTPPDTWIVPPRPECSKGVLWVANVITAVEDPSAPLFPVGSG